MNDTLAKDTLHIREKMAAVRSRGLVNARELGEEVERLGDWREHVRAHPIPLAIAAAVLGYWMVPSRPKRVIRARSEPDSRRRQSAESAPMHEEKAKTAGLAGMGGAIMGFAGSLLGNAVRSYATQQIQTIFQSKDDHASFVQRQSPTYRH
jgi:hypothetical protein